MCQFISHRLAPAASLVAVMMDTYLPSLRRARWLLPVLAASIVGCGGDDAASPAPGSAAPVPGTAAPSPEAREFRALANDVCATVRRDAPAPLGAAAKAPEVLRYAQAAEKASRATALSLRRLPAPAEQQDEVAELTRATRDAQRTYASVRQAGVDAGSVAAARTGLDESERAVVALAQTAGLPACGGGLGR